MKLFILVIIIAFGGTSASAQWRPYVNPLKPSHKKIIIVPDNNKVLPVDSLQAYLNKPRYALPIPNALVVNAQLLKDSLLLKGNNGKGFNIYESSIDRMKIIMPDGAVVLK